MGRKILFILGLGLIFLNIACSSPETDAIDNICGQELCYPGPFHPPWISAYDNDLEFIDQYHRKLPCDNKVLETENVITFSDASSEEVKIEYARMTEESLAEIMAVFEVSDTQALGIIDLHSKFRIYSDRYYHYDQAALPNGFLLSSLDSPIWGDRPETDPDFFPWFRREVKHETTHVVQYCLGGVYRQTHFWFTEGVAEHISGGAYTPISCWEEVEEWRKDPHHINPIAIQKREASPTKNVGEYYPLFGLAVRWLVDKRGGNRSFLDIKALFADIGNGSKFALAFEDHLGLTLEYYEAHFWELMETFLPPICETRSRIDWTVPEWNRMFEIQDQDLD